MVIVAEVYESLRKLGLDDDLARRTAQAVLAVEEKDSLASKADLTELRLTMLAELAHLKTALIQWNVGTLIAVAGVVVAVVKLL